MYTRHMIYDHSIQGIFWLIVVLLFSIAFHEATHAFVSHWLGDTTAAEEGRLTLNPVKHLDLYTSVLLPIVLSLLSLPPFFAAKPVPFNPYKIRFGAYGAALIGVAGPFSNLLLAGVASALFKVFMPTGVFELILLIAVELNIALFVFNMIPFPPLDGSRVLYAFAPEGVQNVMYRIESGGFLSIFIFMFVLYPFLGPLVLNVDNALSKLLLGVSLF